MANPIFPHAGSRGIREKYRIITSEYIRTAKAQERWSKLTPDQRLEELEKIQRMLEKLHDMELKFEKKVVRQESDDPEQEDETVEIKKSGDVVITTPKPPELIEDPESLATSPDYKEMLKDMPFTLVRSRKKKPEPEPVPEQEQPAESEFFE